MKRKLALIFLSLFVVTSASAALPCRAAIEFFSLSPEQMRQPLRWALCSESDRQSARIQVDLAERAGHLLLVDGEKIKVALTTAGLYQDPMVKVSSLVWDLSHHRYSRVGGVGTVIAAFRDFDELKSLAKMQDEKILSSLHYYVVTAGHVAGGRDLLVSTGQDFPLPVKRVLQDAPHDLTLIELDTTQMPSLPVPMGVYGDFFGARAIVELLELDLSPGGGNWQTRNWTHRYSGQSYRSVPLEATGPAGQASVTLAPWLAVPAHISWSEHFGDRVAGLSRDLTQNQLPSFQAFPRGYSGSPLTLTFLGDAGPAAILGGVLSMSESSVGSSFVGPAPIYDLVSAATKSVTRSDSVVAGWALLDGFFVRVESSVEVFVYSGPVGNGITVDGSVAGAPPAGMPNELSEKFRRLGIDPSDAANKLGSIPSGSFPADTAALRKRQAGLAARLQGLNLGPGKLSIH